MGECDIPNMILKFSYLYQDSIWNNRMIKKVNKNHQMQQLFKDMI